MEVAGSGTRVIAGEQVGIKAHVGGAARVGVIGEAYKFDAGDGRAEADEAGNIVAANFRAENDDEILFGAQLVAEGRQTLRGRVARAHTGRDGFESLVVAG